MANRRGGNQSILCLGACRCLVEDEGNRQVSQKLKALEQSQKQLTTIIIGCADDAGGDIRPDSAHFGSRRREGRSGIHQRPATPAGGLRVHGQQEGTADVRARSQLRSAGIQPAAWPSDLQLAAVRRRGSFGHGLISRKAGFLEFSHVKTVVGKPAVPDTLSLVYPPYDGLKKILISAVSHTPRVR